MLIASFILVISLAAAVQFAIMTWRGELARIAMQSASPAASLAIAGAFPDVSAYQSLCPDLSSSSAPKLTTVKLYYTLLESVKSLSENWASREMTLCAQYATAVLAQRIERNQACLAEVRSF